MGHLSIITLDTIEEILDTGFISTRGDIGSKNEKGRPYLEKTVADLFSDALATRKGDVVYPWIVKDKKSNTPNVGFQYKMIISGNPIFVKGEEYPIKIPLESEYNEYDNALSEAEALDIFRDELLWNAIGKKSLGRGRSITHQSPKEDKLIEKLLGSYLTKKLKKKSYSDNNISIELSQTKDNLGEYPKSKIWKFEPKERLKNLNIEDIQWVKKNGGFTYEKALEAWLMENIDSPNCDLKDYFFNNTDIEWFGNYLPYGVLGKNIDIVVLHQGTDDLLYSSVIELKQERLTKAPLLRTIKQIKNYSNFIAKAFQLDKARINPIIICHSDTDPVRGFKNVRDSKLKWDNRNLKLVGYKVSGNKVEFKGF